jgi:CrcB protein
MIADAGIVAIVAGGLGSVVRYLVSVLFAGRGILPWAVLVVNVAGAAVGGTAVGLATSGVLSTDLRLVLFTGFAGGLTTFSTWSVESMQLIREGKWRSSVASIALNLVVGLTVASVCFLLAGGR